MKYDILYVVASPFQFYAALIDYYENSYKNGIVLMLRYKNDNIKYYEIYDKLSLNNLLYKEIYIDDIAIMKKNKIGLLEKINKQLKKIIFLYKEYFKYKGLCANIAKIGDKNSFEQLFFAKNMSKKITEFLGDGASLVFDKDLTIPISYKRKILSILARIADANKLNTNNYDFFVRKSRFIEKFYKNLPIKEEIWLFGQSGYFIEPADLKYYSKLTQEAIKEGKGFNFKDEYFNILRKIKNKFNNDKIYYFPHRNEIVFDEIKEIFEIANFGYFSEVLPLMLGYLPKTIIGTSTTIFSFSKINKHLDKKVELVYYPFTEKINKVYESYDAKNLLEIIY